MGRAVKYDRGSGCLLYTPPLKLVVCSPIPFILQELGTGFLRQGQVHLGDVRLEVKEMSAASHRVQTQPLRVRMLSPVVVYSTMKPENGRAYTYYYAPFEPRFAELIAANLAKKHLIIYGCPALPMDFRILPAALEERDLKITRYKDIIIKGWMGDYLLQGDPQLLQVALDTGLGAKNSQGYGCCAPVT